MVYRCSSRPVERYGTQIGTRANTQLRQELPVRHAPESCERSSNAEACASVWTTLTWCSRCPSPTCSTAKHSTARQGTSGGRGLMMVGGRPGVVWRDGKRQHTSSGSQRGETYLVRWVGGKDMLLVCGRM